MCKLINVTITLLLVFSLSVYSQNDKKIPTKKDVNGQRVPVKTNKDANKTLNVKKQNNDSKINITEQDYKIISSNSSYIEIEFYPSFHPRQTIKYDGQNFDIISFENNVAMSSYVPGQPDIRTRNFAIFLPSEDRNTITVIDYDENDVRGLTLAPIPTYSLKNTFDHRFSFDNINITYNKNQNFYGQNKFFPESIAVLPKPGSIRENVLGNIILSPYQYNPVTGVLKQFTRIRVRITFGQNPVINTRSRTLAERELLSGAALNADIGINWKNPKVNFPIRNSVVENSVMNIGDWYRIEIKDNGGGASDGIYKINKSFLTGAGINLTNIDPRTIKMYGNGGKMLDSDISKPRPTDLDEVAVYISNETSGHFGDNDYILFYGQSINNWSYDSIAHKFQHVINFYDTTNYYWICLNTPNYGKRMQVIQSSNVSNAIVPSSFTEKLFFEPEVSNLVNEGNVWLSEGKSNGQAFIWNNTLTGLENNTDMLYKTALATRVLNPYNGYFLVKEDNSSMSDYYIPLSGIDPGYGNWIATFDTNFSINSSIKTNGEESSFRATFYTNDPSGTGYLDWMEIQYKRRLNSVSGDNIRIVNTDTNQNYASTTVEYNVSPFSSSQILVFEATDHNNVNIINPLSTSSNGVRFQRPSQPLTKYFVVGQNGFKTPTRISQRFSNQNLHGISDGADFIIISYRDFIPAANRLKAKREAPGIGDPSYLKSIVIDVQQIYNEFSGGLFDPVAIRDFIKYAYDNWTRKPSYICLMGDGGFDYRNIISSGGNYVPAYEFSDPNYNLVSGYTSDDFFTQLGIGSSIPFISIGRIPANSLGDANNYMDKEDCYESGSSNGYWKNKVVFVADDGYTGGNSSDGSQHTDQSEQLAGSFLPETFEQIKIYLIAYPPVITPGGRRKPDVNRDIIKYWNEGCIAMNWVGHGSPDVWAHEYVFEKDVAVAQLHNTCKYPFLTVASCEFSQFDNPNNVSGAELLTTVPKSGTIGTMAATRPTYGQLNSTFNNTVWSFLYYVKDTLLLQCRFGSAVFRTKQILNGVNDLKFELLCDPTLRDQYPRFHSRVDSISGLSSDTMRALSRIQVYGSIIHPDSSFWSDYNGQIYMKVFDAQRHITMTDEFNFVFNFTLQGGIIYAGTQIVKNGLWSIEYIVPKDLSYQNQNGKLINYFYNSTYDGSSVYKNFIVGGIDPDASIDTTGPQVNLFLNDHNFRSGDIVNENFNLLVDLYDESGINTTGTIGHKIEATINNDNNNKIDLTQYYNSDTTYKSGHLTYAFSDMAPGHYNLKVRAWDTYNNSTESSIDFTVSTSSALQVNNVYNFPNPFKDKTMFTFQHNYPNPVNVKIKIYTISGRLIREISQNNITDKFVAINWDGLDQDGDRLSNGVYIYRLTVDNGSGSSVVSTGKLAVLK